MRRRAIFRETQMVKRSACLSQQLNYFGRSGTEHLRRLPIGKDHPSRLLCHVNKGINILRAFRVIHIKKLVLVGRAVGVDIPDQLAAVSPKASVPPGPNERWICVFDTGHGGIHQQPHNG